MFLPKSWYATCGAYDVNTDSTVRQVQATDKYHPKPIGSGCEVIDQREVELGTRTDAGAEVPGSTLEIECDNGTPCFVKPDTPLPGRLYQIKPFSTLYVAVGHYHSRDLVTPALQNEDATCKIDFEKLATDHVHLVHRGDGVLTMDKTPANFDVNKSSSSSVAGGSMPGSPRPFTSHSQR